MDQLRWGLIGCGDVARKRVARAIQDEPRSKLVAACRRDKTKLSQFCDEFEIEHAHTNSDELIGNSAVDAVYIATPVSQHLPQTVASARAGKHVLVEKPMAMSVGECNEMIDACHDAGVKLSVAYYRRFYPLVHRIQQLVQEGEIGKPMAVSAVTATSLAMKPGQDGYWRVIPEDGGGGSLMDIGSHRINVFLHLFGEIAHVKAICETVVADYDAEDSALLLMKFQNGLVGTLQCFFGSSVDPDEFVVVGTHGRLVARPLNGDELLVETSGGKRTERHPPADNLCGPLVSDFVSAILDNRQPTVTGEEGRAANDVMARAYVEAKSSNRRR
jgi:predicted dehydrogenase